MLNTYSRKKPKHISLFCPLTGNVRFPQRKSHHKIIKELNEQTKPKYGFSNLGNNVSYFEN